MLFLFKFQNIRFTRQEGFQKYKINYIFAPKKRKKKKTRQLENDKLCRLHHIDLEYEEVLKFTDPN